MTPTLRTEAKEPATMRSGMTERMIRHFLLLTAMAAMSAFAGGYGTKIIYTGWDLGLAEPADVLKRAEDLNRLPVAGITVRCRNLRQQDGTVINAETITTDPLWHSSTLDRVVPTYRKITAFPNLKESFVICSTQPRNKRRFAWSDDAEWGRIASNFRVLAAAAKSGGLRGILIDNEDYHGTRQFRHMPEKDGPYDDTVRLVRQRGREVFGAIFDEYPEIVLFFFWAYIDNEYAHLAEDPMKALRESGRLTCAFLDGMLDVMPMTAAFVEGNENAYSYEAKDGRFDRAAVEVLSDMVSVVTPENRPKYRALVRNSFGLFLDEYTMGPTRIRGGKEAPNHWYRGARNGSRAEHFRENLEAAVRAADEYLWVYGEKFSSIRWGKDLDPTRWSLRFDTASTWDDMIGLSAKLRLLADPKGYFPKRLAELRRTAPDFDLGAFSLSADGTNAMTRTVSFADMTNRIPYAIDVEVRGDARVAAYWLRDGKWCLDIPPEWFVEAECGAADADGWRRATALVRGPADVDSLDLQFTAKSGTAEFRNATFRRFDTDAPAGRMLAEPRRSADSLLSRKDLKDEFGRFPKLWRRDGDLIVFQSTMFLDMMIEMEGRK